MQRIITYRIPEEYDNLKIEGFLRRKGYSRQCLIELKKTEGSILLNESPRHFNERLHSGDLLRVTITEPGSSHVPPVPIPVPVLYEDEDILVVSKPAGMPTHPSYQNRGNSLANALAWYYREQDPPFVFRCSNRLDRDTSGVTVVARHYLSASVLSTMGTKRQLHREYLAIVKGETRPLSGRIDVPLGRKEGSIIERCVDFEHGERAVTNYRVLKTANGHSLLLLRLETGRTHQIRIHMKHLGYPLIGDYLYYPDMTVMSRQALHSYRMSFPHPVTGEPLSFSAPLPEDMQRAVTLLGLDPDPG